MVGWIFAIGIVLLSIVIVFSSKKVREDFSDAFSTLFWNTKWAKKKREAKNEQKSREYWERIARQKAEREEARAKREAEAERIRLEREERERQNAELARQRLEREAKQYETPTPVKNKPLPYLFTNEQIMTTLQKLDEITAKTAYRLSINYERTPDLFSTKLGGVPYWRSDMEYPVASDGTPLVMLAQINLCELENNDVLPKNGILQFFIGADSTNPAHRVVYHSEIDNGVYLDVPTTLTCTAQGLPLNKEFALDTEKATVSMGGSDYKLSERFNEAATQVGLSLPENAPEGTTLYSEAYRCLPDTFDERHELNKGSWLLGYPHFAQEDVRYYKENEHYDTLLFQLDSVFNPTAREYDVLWGDDGVGNYFINSEDLKKLDFSNTLFSTDCY